MPRSRRNSFTTAIAFVAGVALLVSACGGGDDDDDDSSEPGGSDATATQDSGGNQSGNNPTATPDSGGGSGGDDNDVVEIAKDLVPPKSKELLRYDTDDSTSVSYESTESLDGLKDFYDDRLDDLDLNQVGTMSMPDSHSWFIGTDSGRGAQGSVTIVNAADGKTNITITLAKGT